MKRKGHGRWQKPILLLAVIMPQGIKRFLYRHVFGWKIGQGVQIGLSYIDSNNVEIGDNTRIGHFNIFRELRQLKIGENCYLANFNEIFGARQYDETYTSVFEVGNHVNFMSHHFVDTAGTVSIGDKTTIGGRDTHFWSHTILLLDGERTMQPTQVCIGQNTYVGARVTLVGCSIPEGSMVGAGSVVTKSFPPEANRILIAGNPAIIKKRYEICQNEL
jgi:acetyltransferase-like isoleucine patch superfamily enzyme